MKNETSFNLPSDIILPRCSTRAKNVLHRNGRDIKTLGDLKEALEKDLYKARQCGAKTVLELCALLQEHGVAVELNEDVKYRIKKWEALLATRKTMALSKR